MGKAQSKRSVDITTEPSKEEIQEGTGKLEKIEDKFFNENESSVRFISQQIINELKGRAS
jgi:hypothetical protein